MLESILKFRNPDSSENINARLSGLIPKGVVKGGVVVPEPNSLQVRIKGDGISPFIFLAFASDGMVIREKSSEHVLSVEAGITSVVVMRAKYVESIGGTISQFEVLPLGSYENDPDPDSLIRLCSVSPPVGAVAVLTEHINMGFRDSIEGFTRRIVRDVVGTKEDLPSVSGFPAMAEINFLGNDFALGSSITIGTGAGLVDFPIMQSIHFSIAPPATPGLSRVHPSQKTIVAVAQSPLSGLVTAVTTTPHGFTVGQYVRISDCSASQANQLWLVAPQPSGGINFTVDDILDIFTVNSHGFAKGLKVQVSSTGTLPTGLLPFTDYYVTKVTANTFMLSDILAHAIAEVNTIDVSDTGTGVHTITPQLDTSFYFYAPLTLAWSGTGGNVVDRDTEATVVAKTSAGVTHTLTTGSQFTISGCTDRTFEEGLFTVVTVIDSQSFMYKQTGYPTADTGNGTITKQAVILPLNSIEIGESATATAKNFEFVFNASILGIDIAATAIGSSLQFMASLVGEIGNTYTLAKSEPSVLPADEIIVLSGATFEGGVDPNPSASATVDLLAGDLYVVLYGSSGTMEIWGYDGVIFRNLTSASTATLLDFHRRNLFLNEKHLTENEKAALKGSVGVPSETNRYITEEDTSTLTSDIAAALTGADNVAPDGNNKYLTEARKRGERGEVEIPSGQDYVEVPLTDGSGVWSLVVGKNNVPTDSSYAIPFFNVVFTDTLYDPSMMTDRGGPTEYSQTDFSPVVVDKIYATRTTDPVPPPFLTELNPSLWVEASGVFPRADATYLGLPTRLWVKFNQIPDNGSATLLFSKMVTEKHRKPAADMFAPPQRILPSQVQDLINRGKELRFNAGIKIYGTTVEFPANLFTASNIQDYVLKRYTGSKAVNFTDGFTIDFETGAVTGDVDTVTLIPFTIAGGTVNKWTKYLMALTPQGRIQVRHISNILEKLTDQAYATSISSISQPSLPFSDGSYVFAAIYVQSDGVDSSTTILNLNPENLELYPYQGSNEKDYGIPIVCGDGINSFGHFTGTDAHIRALSFASSGRTIKLEKGTYTGNLLVNKDDITIEGSAGAVVTAVSATAFTVVAKRCTIKNLMFDNCDIAIDMQGGADNCNLSGIIFESGVNKKIKAPSIYDFSPSDVAINPVNTITLGTHTLVEGASGSFTSTGTLPSGLSTLPQIYYVVNPTLTTIQISALIGGAPIGIYDQGSGTHYFGDGKIVNLDAKTNFNVWTVSDGTNLYGVGDFNSPSGIQQAHAAATAGDVISILPGVYSRVILTKDRIQYKGIGSGEVRINGEALTSPCITLTGSFNQFDNITVENSTVGIDCQTGATFNHFSSSVTFSYDIDTFIKMPPTDTEKHYNYHPLVCGRVTTGKSASVQQSAEVTIGDGLISWGDYVGKDAINLALSLENEGTRLLVQAGEYYPLSITRNNFIIQGAGAKSVIRQIASPDPDNPAACITIVNLPNPDGAGNKISGFYLVANNNEAVGLTTIGVDITGDDNYIEDIKFELQGSARIEPNKRYVVRSGFNNRFVPHTGAPTGYISWTVGDGVHSFGDFNGMGAIIQAVNALPTEPSGTMSGLASAGILSGSTGSTVTFSDPNIIGSGKPMGEFVLRDIHRYICIKSGVNAGSYKIIAYTPTSVTLERYDGVAFINETDVYWNFLSGAKIWVLPGQYDTFDIPNYRNDVEIEAWGSGSDTVIVGDPLDSPLLLINGNRCTIKGFRFAGGVPITGVAIEVNGSDNTFTENTYETAIRYSIGSSAFNNKIYDAPESSNRTYYTVSTYPSRGDFVGSSEAVIQAALDAAAVDDHINKVVLGNGVWTLASTIYVPDGITLEGSGALTELLGDGLFPALTLNSSGYQTISGIRFNTFSYSIAGTAANVFAYGNWLISAPIDTVNVTGNLTMNI